MISTSESIEKVSIPDHSGNCGPEDEIINAGNGQSVIIPAQFAISNPYGLACRTGLTVLPMTGAGRDVRSWESPLGPPSGMICPPVTSHPTIASWGQTAPFRWLRLDAARRTLWVPTWVWPNVAPYWHAGLASSATFSFQAYATDTGGVVTAATASNESNLLIDTLYSQAIYFNVQSYGIWFDLTSRNATLAGTIPFGNLNATKSVSYDAARGFLYCVSVGAFFGSIWFSVVNCNPSVPLASRQIFNGFLNSGGQNVSNSCYCPEADRVIAANLTSGNPLYWAVDPISHAVTPSALTAAGPQSTVVYIPNSGGLVVFNDGAGHLRFVLPASDTLAGTSTIGSTDIDDAQFSTCRNLIYLTNGTTIGGGIQSYDPNAGFAVGPTTILDLRGMAFDPYANQIFAISASTGAITTY